MATEVTLYESYDGRIFQEKEIAEKYEEVCEYLRYLKTVSEECLTCTQHLEKCRIHQTSLSVNTFYLSCCDKNNRFIDWSIQNYSQIKKYWEDKFRKENGI